MDRKVEAACRGTVANLLSKRLTTDSPNECDLHGEVPVSEHGMALQLIEIGESVAMCGKRYQSLP